MADTRKPANNNAKKPRARLTPRQDDFARAMAESGNGAKAARETGTPEKSAREVARKRLTNVDILQRVEFYKQSLRGTSKATKDQILRRLSVIAFGGLDAFVNAKGALDWKGAKKANSFQLIKKFKETVKRNGDVVREIELHDPLRAVSEIADLEGWKQKPSENQVTIEKLIASVQMYLQLNQSADLRAVVVAFCQNTDVHPDALYQAVVETIPEAGSVM